MAQAGNSELVDSFEQFFRNYYDSDIKQLAQRYPNEQRSLHVDWQDLYRYDPDLADDFINQPEQLQRYAEEALRLYDLPIDVSLGQAHVRVTNLPETESPEIRDIRARDMNSLVQVRGIVRKATDVRPKIEEAAFECQLCGTLTRVPQSSGDFQEPHECQGCERQGPFRVNFDQSEFVDSQKLRIQESPEGLRGGETPQSLDVHVEDDITGEVTPGDHVSATGVLRLEQQENQGEKSPVFDFYMEGMSVEIDEEQFEDMDISDEDKKQIYEISNQDDVYEQMVASIAPSIYGYDQEKLAMILQLFSGVTKQLPDGSRIRGDLHMLLIGDPGTGKSQMLGYIQNIAPRAVYTSGKGSSSAGLTAAAVRDDFGDGQQWTLEAGALVLADQGIAAVDELDKMRCVTSETVVELADGSNIPIGDIAQQAAIHGEIEPLSNGRTIRDIDVSVRTMTNSGTIVERPVTAVHQYEAPSELIEVITKDGNRLRSTPDHPYFVHQQGNIVERQAEDLTIGDQTLVPRGQDTIAADGGIGTSNPAPDAHLRNVEHSEIADVRRIDNSDWDYVYDLTVEGTHNFIANGMVVHNSEDRSAMHEALEQQKISVSKAGINATLKSRCSLLGAANPKYGRFDHYEPISEQIDLEPALISRFDLIFTVTDQPDEEKDRNLAEHIITTNYAGELTTQREEMASLEVSTDEIAEMTDQVDPEIDAELLRKYIAYAKQNCHPRMTEAARNAIRDFYVDLRSKGTDEDAPIPVTARKLEALVRLSEASARVRLSDTVEEHDANRVIEIVRSCLQDIGVDPETGEFDADIVEAGTSKSQRDRIKNLKGLISDIEEEYDEGAPVDIVMERAEEIGMDQSKAEHEIEKLKQKGEVYEPSTDNLRTT
ncbi:AAA family ATPase [Halosolutus halophilus]|uniref:AAA family ATPase n=1 Tax=Halosolutus halophilus TaxID=1552990 RepID=UPI0022352D62|nr:AAA family ATPase [Halosolutus halophilus]